MNGPKLSKVQTKHIPLYLMFLPAAVLLLIFCYYPMYGVTLAFKDFSVKSGILGSKWVGFKHFAALFNDPNFLRVLVNTIRISVLKFACGFPVPILLALMLNEIRRSWFKRTIQTISYLPYFISWVIVSGILIKICSIDGGAVNNLLEWFGAKPINFFGNSDNFIAMLILSDIWKGAGWGTIIYFAAISGINPELYEAAMIDGAGRFQKIGHITMPGIVPAISITLIFALSGLMSAGFDQVFNLYNPIVMDKADIIDTYIFRMGISQGNYGVSAALGLFNSLISLTLIILANQGIKKLGADGIW